MNELFKKVIEEVSKKYQDQWDKDHKGKSVIVSNEVHKAFVDGATTMTRIILDKKLSKEYK